MKTVSLKYAAQLKANGFPQAHRECWFWYKTDEWKLWFSQFNDDFSLYEEKDFCMSPTADEILDILPNRLGKEKRKGLLEIDKTTAKNYCVMYTFIKSVNSNSLADALARMWLYLKEKDLLRA